MVQDYFVVGWVEVFGYVWDCGGFVFVGVGYVVCVVDQFCCVVVWVFYGYSFLKEMINMFLMMVSFRYILLLFEVLV